MGVGIVVGVVGVLGKGSAVFRQLTSDVRFFVGGLACGFMRSGTGRGYVLELPVRQNDNTDAEVRSCRINRSQNWN